MNPSQRSRYRGCLLGGAIGDALGAPIEFFSLDDIRRRYGAGGVADMDIVYGRKGAITDDTQMTLFTAEGSIRALIRGREKGICHIPSVVHHAYLRWLHTQGHTSAHPLFQPPFDGWLIKQQGLFERRVPGKTCVSALMGENAGARDHPINNSKGCGGVMRVAPVGLLSGKGRAFGLGAEIAALTHSHPSGYLAAGALALLIALLRDGAPFEHALEEVMAELKSEPSHEETLEAVEMARILAGSAPVAPETIESIGGGWVAEQALAIAVYCVLVAGDDFEVAVRLAVNHSGDSDSTGAITGNILGVMLGDAVIPPAWLVDLEMSDVITQVADDLLDAQESTDGLWSRYPGW